MVPQHISITPGGKRKGKTKAMLLTSIEQGLLIRCHKEQQRLELRSFLCAEPLRFVIYKRKD
jgi:hypothetical protein